MPRSHTPDHEIREFTQQLRRVEEAEREYRGQCANLVILLNPRISRYLRDGRAFIRDMNPNSKSYQDE